MPFFLKRVNLADLAVVVREFFLHCCTRQANRMLLERFLHEKWRKVLGPYVYLVIENQQ